MNGQRRGIGWDLDHTLVGIRPTSPDRFAPVPLAGAAFAMELRPGAAQALGRLSARGYTQYITTGATREYAERALQSTGIARHFAGIFSGEEIDVGLGKCYRPLAWALDLSDDEARKRMIVVGDVVYDQPADIDGLVFIQQPDGFRHDAGIIADIICLLEETGAGDMSAGFATLYSAARLVGRQLPLLGSGYLATVSPGTTLYLELRTPHLRGERQTLFTVPTVLSLPDEVIAYYWRAPD